MLRLLALLLCVLALAACAEPLAPPDDGLAWPEETNPGGTPVAPPPPVMRDEGAEPPAYRRTVPAAVLAEIDTTAESGGLFDYIGVYHGSQAPAADGERWLALDSTNGQWELVPVTIRTRAARDEIVDEPGAPVTGIEVRTERSTRLYDAWHDPALLFIQSPRLAAGPVDTAFSGLWGMEPDTEMTLRLGDASWTLESAALDGQPYQAVLLLDGVPVVSLPSRDAGIRILHWAGDLDGDGALDIVVNASEHYNMSVLQLWLSSAAEDGAPLGLAARHTGTGC